MTLTNQFELKNISTVLSFGASLYGGVVVAIESIAVISHGCRDLGFLNMGGGLGFGGGWRVEVSLLVELFDGVVSVMVVDGGLGDGLGFGGGWWSR